MSRRRRRSEALYDTRLHGVALVRPVFRAGLVAAAGIALVVLGGAYAWPAATVGAGVCAVAALAAFRAVLAWDRTRVVVTRDELFVVHGLLRRRTAAVEFGSGSALEIEQGLGGRILGYGTVVAGELAIPHVPRPRQLVTLAG